MSRRLFGSDRPAGPARLPPPGLPGLDPSWSRLVTTTGADGVPRQWHLLDRPPQADDQAGEALGTLLCVHGNPTWSYLWRHLVAAAPRGWRVVAPDQLGMGFSERVDEPRTLADRVSDLGDLTAALGIDGPVVTVAHDWGGPISLGWALDHLDQVRGVVLANTAVHQPTDAAPPALIRLARSAVLRDTVCVRTPAFVRSTTALSLPRLSAAVRDAFAAPYASASRRQAVGDFVADIPFEDGHPSRPALDRIRDGLPRLGSTPVLMLWGPRDPVFADRYLRDLISRLPQADVHRYEGASHLVTEDAPESAAAIARWVQLRTTAAQPAATQTAAPPAATQTAAPSAATQTAAPPAATQTAAPAAAAEPDREGPPPVWAALTDRAADLGTAIVEVGPPTRRLSFAELERRVAAVAAGLAASGVRPGERVALLVPPGPDLATALYACWRVGAVVVVADAGLGLRSLGRALRGAGPDHVIGIGRGLAAAAAMRVPGRRIASGKVSSAERRALHVTATLSGLAELGSVVPAVPMSPADDEAECAILYTSGATGPAKGVVYRNRQVRAQLAALRSTYGITGSDRLVAAFAPFALYGPLLGIASALPDVDVTSPGDLTATALARAVAAVDATLVFASPSALRNVVETAAQLQPADRTAFDTVRLVMSAGAPVPVNLLREVQALFPAASVHTPYGMTEALPVADISLPQIEAAGEGNGVCVGQPVPGVEVRIAALDPDGGAPGTPAPVTGVTGEICVRAAHVKDRYDRLWATELQASRDPGWHRTSDVGHLDDDGRLWVEGRLAHIVVTANGVVTPVGVEQRVQRLAAVRAAAVVGVGPRGTQQVVVVVEPTPDTAATQAGSPPLAGVELAAAVRAAAGLTVAAVLVTSALPVDIRHQSKVDRARVAAWAEQVLSGHRAPEHP